ncbi:MAG: SUMF1/EgtB/PvdO family nonheme iron enzyme [Ignavibacteriaceae bacterium]|nr:SUMF1/EgtB/PvdO family nonheme iron enzyme [Ignavibacteriaceae bacterium]
MSDKLSEQKNSKSGKNKVPLNRAALTNELKLVIKSGTLNINPDFIWKYHFLIKSDNYFYRLFLDIENYASITSEKVVTNHGEIQKYLENWKNLEAKGISFAPAHNGYTISELQFLIDEALEKLKSDESREKLYHSYKSLNKEVYEVLNEGQDEKVLKKSINISFKRKNKLAVLLGVTIIISLLIYILFSIPPKPLERMVFVKGGTFVFGCIQGRDGKCLDSETPSHQVTLDDFFISTHEVNQFQWEQVMGFNPSTYKGDSLPVSDISWFEAVQFCNYLSEREGLSNVYLINGTEVTKLHGSNGYRLPTEAEWEFAARGGLKSKGFLYSGDNKLNQVGWYQKNSGSKPHSIMSLKPNELGIYDMSGNVWEWCWDIYGPYTSSNKTNPLGPSAGKNRVYRGASWFNSDVEARLAFRKSLPPGSKYFNLGFRLARNANKE